MERNKNVVLKNSTLKATKVNKKQERISKQKLQETGITLIALVVTIVILLILSGVAISAVVSNNGLFGRAQNAVKVQEKASVTDDFKMIIGSYAIDSLADKNLTLEDYLTANGADSVTANGEDALDVEYKGYIFTVNKASQEITNTAKAGPRPQVSNYKVVSNSNGTGENVSANSTTEGTSLYINFDASIEGGTTTVSPTLPFAVTKNGTYTFTITGTVGSDKFTKTYDAKVGQYKIAIKVGDWINYSAGTWSQTEINSMGSLYSGASMPTSSNPYTFGGFKAGDSKNDSRNPGYTNNGAYVNIYPSGWRVLSIENDGTIKITTAGSVEGYYHPSETNSGYKSEYILNENTTNTNVTATIKAGLTARKWTMYENGDLVLANSAHCMTYDEALKVTGNTNTPASDSVRRTGAYYWLASAYNSNYLSCVNYDGSLYYDYDVCFGVRPVVSLKSNIQITGGTGADKANAYTLALQ